MSRINGIGKNTRCALVLHVAFIAAAFISDGNRAALAAESGEDMGWERYQVIMERNIFLRDRSRPAPTTPISVSPPIRTERPERSLVLVGIVRDNHLHVAFLEDIRTGAVNRYRTGEQAAGGTIAAITLEHLDFDNGETITGISIGHNLAGEAVGGGHTRAPTQLGDGGHGTAHSAPSARRPTAISEDQREIIERMRQRRLEQLGGN